MKFEMLKNVAPVSRPAHMSARGSLKHGLGIAAILSVSLFVGRVAHATDGWIQIPGAATQIAVGANDIPFILDINGIVQYLAPKVFTCGTGICVPNDRQWTATGIVASVIATDQYGYLWKTDSNGAVAHMGPSTNAFSTNLTSVPIAAVIESLSPGRMQVQPYPEWNFPFGKAAGKHSYKSGETTFVPYTRTCVTSSNTVLSSTEVMERSQMNGTQLTTWDTTSGWNTLDSSELQVTQFTMDGSATQVPWVVVQSGQNRIAYVVASGPWRNVGSPVSFGKKFAIDWLTDHYAAASNGALSAVWSWSGNAGGTGGAWTFLPNADVIPSGAKIAKIAFASALPGTALGTIGPSHLYMIDTLNNIYQWGILENGVQ